MGDEERKIIITYRAYVSSDSRHRANLKKEKKDIDAGLKKLGANIIKSTTSKEKGQERLLIEYVNSLKRHNYRLYVENTKDKSVLFLEISVKEEDLENLKDEIQKCMDSVKNK